MLTEQQSYPLAGKVVELEGVVHHNLGEIERARVEDWWHKITGKSWMFSEGNPAVLFYAMRSGFKRLPTDNKVVYVKTVGGAASLGILVHESEIKGEIDASV